MKSHFSDSVLSYAQKSGLVILYLLICALSLSSFARGDTATPKTEAVAKTGDQAAGFVLRGDVKKLPLDLENVGVNEHLSSTLDLEHLTFTDANDGKPHALKEYFHNGKPVLLNLVYFECPMLCTMVVNGVLEGLKGLDWSIGKEFNVVTISINPKDDTGMALKKRENYLKAYLETEPGQTKRDAALAKSGWNFFTGSEEQIQSIANQVGFSYKYDKIEKQYAHPAVTFVLTPEGKISRYLYGIQYRPRDLRLSLLEASQGKIGNVFDRILMFCYHYEPSARGYSLQMIRVMQTGAAGTTVLLGGYLSVFWTRQRKRERKA